MKKEYTLQGLDCANCARKIEDGVKEITGVTAAAVNYATETLKLDIDDTHGKTISDAIEKVVHKYEPDIIIIEKSGKTHINERNSPYNKLKLIQLLSGAAISGAAILFKLNAELKLFLFAAGYAVLGGEIIFKALKNILKGRVFDENFLMAAATAGAFCIGEYPEAVAVMLFYRVGEYFQNAAIRKSRKAIAGLMDLSPEFANLKTRGEIIKVLPDKVAIGDIIVVKPGEKIPLDGVIIEGSSTLDTKSLTGEAAPRRAEKGDAVLSGCINQNGLLTVRVTKEYGESTAVKIMKLIESASEKKAHTENFITEFSKYYTPVVVSAAFLIALIMPLVFNVNWVAALNRSLVFLVISCPCALVISIPLSYFGGIGAASKKGVLVKGGNYLDALNKLDIVIFDKTGTLTKGVFTVSEILPAESFCSEELLAAAAYAEAFSNHPIALSICKAYGKDIQGDKLQNYEEAPGYGVKITADGKNIIAGSDNLMRKEGISFEPLKKHGTKVYVAINSSYAGCIIISDEVKPDSREAVSGLKDKGVRKTVMLTGDGAKTGEHIARELNIDEVYTELLPAQKVEMLETLAAGKRRGTKLAFVGDGVNDAPVLAMADIGIAMGALGSDAAIEAADIVLITDEPKRLLDAIDIAKYTKRVVWQNIIFAIGIKAAFLILGALGAAAMWEAVFADVGVSVLAVVNSMRILKCYDK